MPEQHHSKHKSIEVKSGSLGAKLSELAEARERRADARAGADPYADGVLRGFENTKIDYPNAALLNRPLDMPSAVRRGLVVLLAAAAVLGGIFLFRYFDAVVSAPAREEAQVAENASRTVPYNLPVLLDLAPLDDEAMMASLSGSGDTLFERTPIGSNENGGFQVVRLPEGVSVADAAAMYLAGLDNVSASSAARLLNGAWDLTVTREESFNLFLRFADFSSGSVENAIQNALLAEGLESASESDSGVDDAGNTFVWGTVEHDDAVYTWRVSVIGLSEVYDIKGLPEDALYVGIRLTENPA